MNFFGCVVLGWKRVRARRLLVREKFCPVHLAPKRYVSLEYVCDACDLVERTERAGRIIEARRLLGGR